MSDRTVADPGTARNNAFTSAAEQVRASASGAYDPSKKAASYAAKPPRNIRFQHCWARQRSHSWPGISAIPSAEIIAVTGKMVARAGKKSALHEIQRSRALGGPS